MNRCRVLSVACAVLFFLSGATAWSTEPSSKVYEMRIYYAAEGKLDALNARFRNHTVKLFEKHGIANVGYLRAIENQIQNPDRQLIFPFLSFARSS